MIQKKYALIIAVALCATTATLSGCGSSGTAAPTYGTSQAAKADVTVAVKFPSADGAVKSLIPAAAQVIEVYAQSYPVTYDPINPNPNGTLIATLTPTEQSKTVQIAPGNYMIYAFAYNSTDVATRMQVGRTSTGGEIKSGQSNTIVLTFLDGQWTIVNDSDVPTPLVLSNDTQLNDFVIGGESQMYLAAKSSIDPTKPVGGGSGLVRLRFNNNTSARAYGAMASQFVGTATSTILNSDSYNLKQNCGYYNYYGIPCDEKAGDQIVMISGKDNGGSSYSGGYYEGNLLYGSGQSLLPGGGQTSFTQNNAPIDLMAVMPDTIITGGNIITGGIVEWKPSTDRTVSLGSAATAKRVKSSVATKAQSVNNTYADITVKNYETVVCSGTNPQNRGTWTFSNNSSAGKVVIGSRVCYTNYPYLSSQYDPITYQYVMNAGDYSYGLVPADTTNLGDYCHQWNYGMNTCLQQLPGAGDVYNPDRFIAVKSTTKTAINYGSFKFNFWSESSQTGTAHVYNFRAKGNTTVSPAK